METKVDHLGFILDGNRRWAMKRALLPWKGHEAGSKKVKEIIEWCKEFNISQLTMYCFSMENFNRPKREVDALFDLFRTNFIKLLDDPIIHENKIHIRFIGRLSLFPEDMRDIMKRLMAATSSYSHFTLNFAIGYSGRAEIVDAAKKIAAHAKDGSLDPEKLDEDMFSKYLYLKESPQLVIRTSGEHRTSNFLLWQSAYSEWYFCPKLFPDFTKDDLKIALDEFAQRKRRYGK